MDVEETLMESLMRMSGDLAGTKIPQRMSTLSTTTTTSKSSADMLGFHWPPVPAFDVS